MSGRLGMPVLLCLVAAVLAISPVVASAQDATLDATLTYVGPGPDGASVYRYDYALTNNAVTPMVIELLVFFDSDPDSGYVFTGDVSDFANTPGFTGAVASPAGWVADVFEDPDPSAWVVDFFNFDGSNAIAPGETLDGFSVTFLWKGAGTPGEQFFEALDGFAHEGRTTVTTVNFPPITGTVTSGCTQEPLAFVQVDLFNEYGELIAVAFTDADGSYEFADLAPGTYEVSINTPVGYVEPGETAVVFGAAADFALECLEFENCPRTIGFWKHQVNAHLCGKGKAQIPLAELLGQYDAITEHFAQNAVHPVEVYAVLPTATDTEKLSAAQDILTVNHKASMNLRARQQLMATLLNVVSLKLAQTAVISSDGATVSQAITHCWDLIVDPDPTNDEKAKTIADTINNGRMVPAGCIPPGTPLYTYEEPGVVVREVTTRTLLQPNFPNPVRAAGTDIRFSLAETGPVSLEIYDVQARLVRTLVRGTTSAGDVTLHWDGRTDGGAATANGLYFYRLTTTEEIQTRKLILAK